MQKCESILFFWVKKGNVIKQLLSQIYLKIKWNSPLYVHVCVNVYMIQ